MSNDAKDRCASLVEGYLNGRACDIVSSLLYQTKMEALGREIAMNQAVAEFRYRSEVLGYIKMLGGDEKRNEALDSDEVAAVIRSAFTRGASAIDAALGIAGALSDKESAGVTVN